MLQIILLNKSLNLIKEQSEGLNVVLNGGFGFRFSKTHKIIQTILFIFFGKLVFLRKISFSSTKTSNNSRPTDRFWSS